MTENKLYAQCREEARWKMKNAYLEVTSESELAEWKDKTQQLTAEIYGMKLLDMSQPDIQNYVIKGVNDWYKSNQMIRIGTTQDLHDHFVREFIVSLTNEGNNSKQ